MSASSLTVEPDCRPDDENEEMEFGMGTVPEVGDTGCINDMRVCMYNESHIVAAGKYHAHTEECRKQNRGASFKENVGLVFCPYNITHRIQENYFDKHKEFCDGYYRHNMNIQEDPLSMQVTYERYKTVRISNKRGTVDNDFFDDRNEWEDDNRNGRENNDDDVPIQDITIEDFEGIVRTPATRGEFRAIQEELAKKLAKTVVRDLPPPKENLVHSLLLADDFLCELEATLPSITPNVKMLEVAKFVQEAAELIRDCKV